MSNILLVGGGGHCEGVIESIMKSKQYNIHGIIDVTERVGDRILDIPIIGNDDTLESYHKQGVKFAFITLGNIGNPIKRVKIYEKLKLIGFQLPTIIDESANVSETSIVEEGVYIGKNVVINPLSTIGKCSIINTSSVVEHDCSVGNFVHISPGTILSGNVKVGHRTHIGSNATIINNLYIGDDCMIGAGSVVTKNIANNKKAFGNPCKVVKEYY